MRTDKSKPHIGIDFDNTIVDYGYIFVERARSLGYLDSGVQLTKDEVKRIVKESNEGEQKWGILQREVYGKGIRNANVMEGFDGFIVECRKQRIPISIVSHKSKYNSFDPQKLNLQQPALDWMRTNRFFDENSFGFNLSQISFSETLEDKIQKINILNCSHFIDDLLKVLLHPLFPKSTRKIHFSTEAISDNKLPIDYAGNWRNIQDYLIQDRQNHDE